jgi:hypothetical protein
MPSLPLCRCAGLRRREVRRPRSQGSARTEQEPGPGGLNGRSPNKYGTRARQLEDSVDRRLPYNLGRASAVPVFRMAIAIGIGRHERPAWPPRVGWRGVSFSGGSSGRSTPAGVTPAAYPALETGDRWPDWETYDRIARMFVCRGRSARGKSADLVS